MAGRNWENSIEKWFESVWCSIMNNNKNMTKTRSTKMWSWPKTTRCCFIYSLGRKMFLQFDEIIFENFKWVLFGECRKIEMLVNCQMAIFRLNWTLWNMRPLSNSIRANHTFQLHCTHIVITLIRSSFQSRDSNDGFISATNLEKKLSPQPKQIE